MMRKKGSIVEACMRERGHITIADEVPSPFGNDTAVPASIGGMAAQAISTLDRMTSDEPRAQAAAEDQSIRDDPARLAALDECYAKAREVSNPYEAFFAFIDRQDRELASRISADARLVEADERLRRCTSEQGYGVAEVSELANLFTQRSNEVLEDGLAGRTSLEVARQKLLQLSKEEEAVSARVLACVDEHDLVARAVRNEHEKDFIDRSGGAIDEALVTLRRAILDEFGLLLVE